MAAIVFSGAGSFVLLKAIGLVMPLRANAEEEAEGLDIALHSEEAYMHSGGMDSISPEASPAIPAFAAKSTVPAN
jgi:Amt family ammonium transporter